jgi:hypothetical protein
MATKVLFARMVVGINDEKGKQEGSTKKKVFIWGWILI